LKKYAVFDGRARRKEYWIFFLFNIVIAIVLNFVEAIVGGPGILGMLYALAVLLPGVGVSIRRLHDTGRSGWWLLICLIPPIGLVIIYFMALEGEPGSNMYGPNPKMA
jgi:uncharacterized membrane protein YhaH (DUF805 family)